MLDTNRKGAIAEAEIAAAAIRLGIPVLRPLAEHGRYDLALELGDRFLRVQCKWARRRGSVILVPCRTNRRAAEGFRRTFYSHDEIDALAAYCADVDRCYLLPGPMIWGKTMIQLRLEPARNHQRAGLHFSTHYEFSGAVAQLEERVTGSHEATGSSPVSSTPTTAPSPLQIGAHEFAKRFGYWTERAAAGEEVLVSRHGTPHIRVTSATGRLRLIPGGIDSQTSGEIQRRAS
jgi:antitoxin (DNA-binding transcriptional repressor) of toxin-antitoxin stability system